MTTHPYADTLNAAREVIQAVLPQLEPHSGGDTGIILSAADYDAMVKAVEALARMVREQYLRDYAETLILEHAEVPFMSVFEMAEEHLVGGGDLTEEEARFVHDLLGDATVTVRMPLLPEGVDR